MSESNDSQNYLSQLRNLEEEFGRMAAELDLDLETTTGDSQLGGLQGSTDPSLAGPAAPGGRSRDTGGPGFGDMSSGEGFLGDLSPLPNIPDIPNLSAQGPADSSRAEEPSLRGGAASSSGPEENTRPHPADLFAALGLDDDEGYLPDGRESDSVPAVRGLGLPAAPPAGFGGYGTDSDPTGTASASEASSVLPEAPELPVFARGPAAALRVAAPVVALPPRTSGAPPAAAAPADLASGGLGTFLPPPRPPQANLSSDGDDSSSGGHGGDVSSGPAAAPWRAAGGGPFGMVGSAAGPPASFPSGQGSTAGSSSGSSAYRGIGAAVLLPPTLEPKTVRPLSSSPDDSRGAARRGGRQDVRGAPGGDGSSDTSSLSYGLSGGSGSARPASGSGDRYASGPGASASPSPSASSASIPAMPPLDTALFHNAKLTALAISGEPAYYTSAPRAQATVPPALAYPSYPSPGPQYASPVPPSGLETLRELGLLGGGPVPQPIPGSSPPVRRGPATVAPQGILSLNRVLEAHLGPQSDLSPASSIASLDAALPAVPTMPPGPQPPFTADVARRFEEGILRAKDDLEEFKRRFAAVMGAAGVATGLETIENPQPWPQVAAAAAAAAVQGYSTLQFQAAPPAALLQATAAADPRGAPRPFPSGPSSSAAAATGAVAAVAEVQQYLQGVKEKYGAMLSLPAQGSTTVLPPRAPSTGPAPPSAAPTPIATQTSLPPPTSTISRGVSARALPADQSLSPADAAAPATPSAGGSRASSADAAAITPAPASKAAVLEAQVDPLRRTSYAGSRRASGPVPDIPEILEASQSLPLHASQRSAAAALPPLPEAYSAPPHTLRAEIDALDQIIREGAASGSPSDAAVPAGGTGAQQGSRGRIRSVGPELPTAAFADTSSADHTDSTGSPADSSWDHYVAGGPVDSSAAEGTAPVAPDGEPSWLAESPGNLEYSRRSRYGGTATSQPAAAPAPAPVPAPAPQQDGPPPPVSQAIPAESSGQAGARVAAVNDLLRTCGFPGVPLSSGGAARPEDLLASLSEVLGQYQRRSRLVSDLMSATEMARQRDAGAAARMDELVRERNEAARRAKKAESVLEAARSQASRADDTKAEAKKWESESARLRSRITQLESQLKAREGQAEQTRAKLEERVAREERRALRDKEVYDKIKRAYVTAGKSASSPSAAGPLRELRPLEVVSLYEAQRDKTDAELASLRAENRSLRDELREAQNTIARKDREGGWRNPEAGAEERAAAAERRVAELARDLAEERSRAADHLRSQERRQAEAERRAERLAEENASLILEVEARPSVREARSLQRQVELLERKLGQERENRSGGGAAAVAGAAAEAGEVVLAAAGSFGAAGSAASLGTRDRIRRDREVHRLGLRHVEQLPRDVLIDLVQDACIALEATDATLLPAQLARVLRAVSALPRLEAFASEVCDVTLRLGAAYLPPAAKAAGLTGRDAPKVVPAVLRDWLRYLEEHRELSGLLRAVDTELARRPGALGLAPPGETSPAAHTRVLRAVRQLVQVEHSAVGSREALEAAEGLVASQPDLVVHRVVSHFQRLFDCPRVEGIIPRMNQVYVGLNESRNFHRNLALMLGLEGPQGPTLPQLAEAVRRVVQMGLGYDKELLHVLKEAHGGQPAPKKPARNSSASAPHAGPLVAVVLKNGDVVWEARREAEVVPILLDGEGRPLDLTSKPPLGFGGSDEGADNASPMVSDGDGEKENKPEGAEQASGLAQPSGAAASGIDGAEGELVAHARACREVLGILSLHDPSEAAAAVERVVRRLQKLDGALPRYQQLARRLMDALRVAHLDEIAPAVEALVRRA